MNVRYVFSRHRKSWRDSRNLAIFETGEIRRISPRFRAGIPCANGPAANRTAQNGRATNQRTRRHGNDGHDATRERRAGGNAATGIWRPTGQRGVNSADTQAAIAGRRRDEGVASPGKPMADTNPGGVRPARRRLGEGGRPRPTSIRRLQDRRPTNRFNLCPSVFIGG